MLGPAGLLYVVIAACAGGEDESPPCPAGTEGCACTTAGDCQPGLLCRSDVCVLLAPVVCGDGVTGPGEGCDDGNAVETDGCTSHCALPTCGDGIVYPDEACDDGNTDETDACLSTCVAASCGDGFVRAGIEQCDDANANEADGCRSNCTEATCGGSSPSDAAGLRPTFLVDADVGGNEVIWDPNGD